MKKKIKVLSNKSVNRWKRISWKNFAERSPVRYKAYRLKMSLTTFKVKNAWTVDQIYAMLQRPQFCPYCQKSMDFEEISIDHITARSDGGQEIIENIQLCCLKCNQMKGCLNDREYKRLLEIVKDYPDLMPIYEKRIEPSLAYFKRRGNLGIRFLKVA